MCRHFAWIGAPRNLHALLFEPSYGLPEQARLPRWQQVGLVNKDGYGAGWYDASRPEVFRTTTPIWEDAGFRPRARALEAACVVGAARAASPGMPLEVAANAPFTDGRHLFSLNGHLSVERNAALLGPGRATESDVDSALLAALLWERLEDGGPLDTTVENLLYAIVERDATACLNMLVSDGHRVVATTWAETLCYREEPDGVLVASEPHDDRDDWTTVPDRSLLVADASSVTVRGLDAMPAAAPTVLPGETVPG
ncbi:ergothioneine biosynthesis protein EgtC [Actinomadura flavalba]|uniref:ergothioneine biosynthesis protein EgtC n=1 Tax=Actinomadura flavalba TaxID=1120938 RepID=UPI00036DB5C0|nr:ergothioneine biosynthesis protein EgtC [Actinomadura flavalba]